LIRLFTSDCTKQFPNDGPAVVLCVQPATPDDDHKLVIPCTASNVVSDPPPTIACCVSSNPYPGKNPGIDTWAALAARAPPALTTTLVPHTRAATTTRARARAGRRCVPGVRRAAEILRLAAFGIVENRYPTIIRGSSNRRKRIGELG